MGTVIRDKDGRPCSLGELSGINIRALDNAANRRMGNGSFIKALENQMKIEEEKKKNAKSDPDEFYIRDNDYVLAMKKKNDALWKNREKNLYYSYKNSSYIIPTALIMGFTFFTKGGIFWCVLILLFVIGLCEANNQALDKDPTTIFRRREIRKVRRRDGEIL